MTKKPNELTIKEAAHALRAREISVRELWDACVAAIEAKNPELNAFLEIFEADDASIRSAQARIDAGEAGPLIGIPLAIKDNILIEGKIASAASKMLENYRASYDATVIRKLKEQGALFLGRTNMDEFAMGSSTEHSAFGSVRNPADPSRVPGGSSGGSAAAVAANLSVAALGSDTGGSIRQPAAHTGVTGMKPSYGGVSRHGLIALGSSLDQIGPFVKSAEDAKILFDAIKGIDPFDSTTLPEALYKNEKVGAKMRIGVPRDWLKEGLDADLLERFDSMLGKLKAAGHEIIDITLPPGKYALAAYYVVMPAEVSTNLARLDGIRYGHAARGATLLEDYVKSRTEGFGKETIRRILLGTFVLSSGYIDAYYRKAEAYRSQLRREYAQAFVECDLIAFPTTPAPAFKFGEKGSDPVAMYLEDVFTVTANLTGMPAISVPMGDVERDGKRLPVGIHFTAPMQAEERLFEIAEEVENALRG